MRVMVPVQRLLMNRKAPTFCRHPSCGELVHGGYCDQHKPAERKDRLQGQKDYNQRRAESDSLYGTQRWRKLSIAYKRSHPCCVECEKEGLVRATEIVDHIVPAKEDPSLFWEWSNLRPLCHDCHNRIGRKVRS